MTNRNLTELLVLRDSRPNAYNKDVPSFLVYPDGSHSLGVISPAVRADEDSGTTAACRICRKRTEFHPKTFVFLFKSVTIEDPLLIVSLKCMCAGNQDSTISGPFVVWADPVSGNSIVIQNQGTSDIGEDLPLHLIFNIDRIFAQKMHHIFGILST
jgi:hypothetical protein